MQKQITGQPTEAAFIVAAQKFGMEDPRPLHDRIQEIPFSSEKIYGSCLSEPINQCENKYAKGIVEKILLKN